MKDEASYHCDSYREEIIVPIDLTAGSRQEYVEDSVRKNSQENRGKRQPPAGLFGQGSCKLPGRAFHSSLNRLPEKTIKMPTRA